MERIAPLAKILAEANGIDWEHLHGTGAGGQIVEQDILDYLTRVMSGEAEPPSTPVDAPPPDWNGEDIPGAGMFDVSALSQAGVDSDITDFVQNGLPGGQSSKPAPAVEVPGTPATPTLASDDFELDDAPEPAPVAPAAAPGAVAPVVTPEPVAPVMPATPEVAPAAAAGAAAGAAGLGSLLSRLYHKEEETPAAAEAVAPVAPAAPVEVEVPAPVVAAPVVSAPEVSAPEMSAPAIHLPPVSTPAPVSTPEVPAPGAVAPVVTPEPVAPVAAPVATAPVTTAPVMTAPVTEVPRDAVWFGTFLRRSADVVQLAELRGQLTDALERDVPMGLLVARAAQRHADKLGVSSVAMQDVQAQQARSVGQSQSSLRDALSAGADAFDGQPELLVVDAGTLELDELHYPETLTLSVGRVQDGRASLSLQGQVEQAKAAAFLAAVAQTLEKPVILLV